MSHLEKVKKKKKNVLFSDLDSSHMDITEEFERESDQFQENSTDRKKKKHKKHKKSKKENDVCETSQEYQEEDSEAGLIKRSKRKKKKKDQEENERFSEERQMSKSKVEYGDGCEIKVNVHSEYGKDEPKISKESEISKKHKKKKEKRKHDDSDDPEISFRDSQLLLNFDDEMDESGIAPNPSKRRKGRNRESRSSLEMNQSRAEVSDEKRHSLSKNKHSESDLTRDLVLGKASGSFNKGSVDSMSASDVFRLTSGSSKVSSLDKTSPSMLEPTDLDDSPIIGFQPLNSTPASSRKFTLSSISPVKATQAQSKGDTSSSSVFSDDDDEDDNNLTKDSINNLISNLEDDSSDDDDSVENDVFFKKRLNQSDPGHQDDLSDEDNKCWQTKSFLDKRKPDSGEFKTGKYSNTEDSQLKANWDRYLKEYPYTLTDDPICLLHPSRAPPAIHSKINIIKRRTMLYKHLAKSMNRTQLSVYQHARTLLADFAKSRSLTDEELKLEVIDLYHSHGTKYSYIGQQVGRSESSVRCIIQKFVSGNTAPARKPRTTWTDEQTNQLRAAVGRHDDPDSQDGPQRISWAQVAKEVDGKDRHQCREKWLRSSVKRDTELLKGEYFKLKLVKCINELQVCNSRDINWTDMMPYFPSAPSPEYLRRMFQYIVRRHIENYKEKSEKEIFDSLKTLWRNKEDAQTCEQYGQTLKF